MYIAQGLVTGDATGGNMLLIFNFKDEGSPASGRFYNIEQVEATQSEAIPDKTFFMRAFNWDIIGAAGLINRDWQALLTNTANNVVAMTTFQQFPLPIFLGITAPVASLAAQLECGVVNVNITTLTVTVQGYIWEPRAVLSEGGLRRPVDSLYGSGRQ